MVANRNVFRAGLKFSRDVFSTKFYAEEKPLRRSQFQLFGTVQLNLLPASDV